MLRRNMAQLRLCVEDTWLCQERLLQLAKEAECGTRPACDLMLTKNEDSVCPKTAVDSSPERTVSADDRSRGDATESWWTGMINRKGRALTGQRAWRSGAAAELASAKGWATQISMAESELELLVPEIKGRGSLLLERIVHHTIFDKVCALVIVANALIMGIQIEYMGVHDLSEPPLLLRIGSLTCTFYFVVELMMRMLLGRWSYFYAKEWKWNIFDLIIVVLSLVELGLDAFGDGASGGISVFRVLRVLRIVRVIRIIRVARFFRELRILISAILHSARPMLWAIVLLLMIMFICSVHLAQAVTDYRLEHEGRELEEWERSLIKHYGTLHESIYTLFQFLSGGNDWGELADPLLQLHWSYSLFMSAYIAFTALAVMNIVTGIFVETAMRAPEDDHDAVLKEEWENESSAVCQIMDLLQGADVDGNGFLERRELRTLLSSPSGSDFLSQLGVEVTQVWGLFKLLDIGDTGSVDAQEFIMGCLRLRGPAKTVDVTTLMYENKRVMKLLSTFFSYVERQFSYLIPPCGMSSSQGQPLPQTHTKVMDEINPSPPPALKL